MIRVFNHYVPIPNILLAVLDAAILLVAIYAGIFLLWGDASQPLQAIEYHLPQSLIFAIVILVMMFAVGLYERQVWRDWSTIAARILVSFVLAFLVLSLIFYFFPDTAIWRSALVIAVALAVAASLALRFLFFKLTDLETFRRRVLVLGTGNIAGRIAALEENGGSRSFFECVGYLQLNGETASIAADRIVSGVNDLTDYVRRQNIEEIVVAVDDRRGRMPVQALLDCRLDGVTVTDFLTFYERETGRVDLSNLNPSWLIFSHSQAGVHGYQTAKRIFDILLATIFLIFTFPLLLAVAIAVRIDSEGPIFYRQERVGLSGRPFNLLKFRTMQQDAESNGIPQWAGKDDPRITRMGQFLRRTRIDEIPQLINIIRGDMSLVGPRPERPYFVENLCRGIPFYGERHRMKPGLTGWAQINYRYTDSVEDAKVKTEFDLYYIKNHSLFLDLVIVLQTLRVIIWPPGVH